MLYLLIIISALQKQVQTNWMGGAGVLGPVTNWSSRYCRSDSITAAIEGQLSLIATKVNYSSWVKHSIESGSITIHTQGLMPADIDNDGIPDIVANTAGQVVWYKSDGNYNFTKNIVGNGSNGQAPCVFPSDLDKDGKIDILSNLPNGIGWFKNSLPGPWILYTIDALTGYHRVSSSDVDLDNDLDIVAVDNSNDGMYYGDIYLFRNDGNMNFSKEFVANLPDDEGFRVYATADFNNDGFPDLYSCNAYATRIFLNDGSGHFNQSFICDLWSGYDFDGAWPSDIDMDGDMDLICGVHPYSGGDGFYAMLNDGTGNNFNATALSGTGVGAKDYGDGAMAGDIDLDGSPDIAGAFFKIGFFRQTAPLNFSLCMIENINNSHWVYVTPLHRCLPSLDLLVTKSDEHLIYENKMLEGFAASGSLTSSILELADTLRRIKYFGWKACIPGDSTLAFRWKAHTSIIGINFQPWSAPVYATKDTDSIALPLAPCARYFQYMPVFKPKQSPTDIALLYEIWLSHDTCMKAGIEETQTPGLSLRIVGRKIFLSPGMKMNDIELSVYNAAGELAQTLYKGDVENKSYIFTPELRSKGVYLVALKYSGGTKTKKFLLLDK